MPYTVEGEEIDPEELEDGTWVTPKPTQGGLDPLDLQHKYRKDASKPAEDRPEHASTSALHVQATRLPKLPCRRPMPRLPSEHYKVVIRPRHPINLANIGLAVILEAIQNTAKVDPARAEEDKIRIHPIKKYQYSQYSRQNQGRSLPLTGSPEWPEVQYEFTGGHLRTSAGRLHPWHCLQGLHGRNRPRFSSRTHEEKPRHTQSKCQETVFIKTPGHHPGGKKASCHDPLQVFHPRSTPIQRETRGLFQLQDASPPHRRMHAARPWNTKVPKMRRRTSTTAIRRKPTCTPQCVVCLGEHPTGSRSCKLRFAPVKPINSKNTSLSYSTNKRGRSKSPGQSRSRSRGRSQSRNRQDPFPELKSRSRSRERSTAKPAMNNKNAWSNGPPKNVAWSPTFQVKPARKQLLSLHTRQRQPGLKTFSSLNYYKPPPIHPSEVSAEPIKVLGKIDLCGPEKAVVLASQDFQDADPPVVEQLR
ncbi:hypothetical protein HPB49_007047 [Dermacentor silvarum]|uniref:Uncharacterized protein n=1 Tax=Dermacentor silvarum TaxID=543639 RepID=A0ACB8D3I0_DERSI|nr:hypothetical protein HPB49_007047 [Dermacentor silvarum]